MKHYYVKASTDDGSICKNIVNQVITPQGCHWEFIHDNDRMGYPFVGFQLYDRDNRLVYEFDAGTYDYDSDEYVELSYMESDIVDTINDDMNGFDPAIHVDDVVYDGI